MAYIFLLLHIFLVIIITFHFHSMMKRLSRQHHVEGMTSLPNIHDLSAAISDDSDSESNDNHVVMLSWNEGKVSVLNVQITALTKVQCNIITI